MIQYILECIAFQLIFLIIYDVFLKRETFFQWNRGYLIGTYLLSLGLPWVKIEAFKIVVPKNYDIAPSNVFQLDAITLAPGTEIENGTDMWSMGMGILYFGMAIAALILCYKLYKLYRMRQKGELRYFSQFTRVIVSESELAFSFFKTIFIGEKIVGENYKNIIAHELVHIRQKHSLDLFFFELMRVVCWYNPLVYIYQHRISELHEFIVDAQVSKKNKTAQYQLLLSQIFKTEDISFVNHFFKSSLIKKRIVMLQKPTSKKIWQLKYLVLFPLIMGMLCYTSCELENTIQETEEIQEIEEIPLVIEAAENGEIGTYTNEVPFAIIEEVPIFPGCEGATDKRACFNKKMREHIMKNFNYPQEAQDAGIQGRVSIMFRINKERKVVNIRKRGPAKILEEEAERIISKLPKMVPGKEKGRAVKMPFSIPITFKLTSLENNKKEMAQLTNTEKVYGMLNRLNELSEERERLLKNSAQKEGEVIKKLDAEVRKLKKELSEHIIEVEES